MCKYTTGLSSMISKMPVFIHTDVNRFKAKYTKSDPIKCWPWIASKNVCGYGIINFRNKVFLAHRVSWFIQTKIDPYPMHVLHTCDSPECVNPNHLFLGTHQDNMTDKVKKGRALGLGGARGSDCHFSKLKEEDVLKIRKLYFDKKFSQKKIGKMFNMTQPAIHYIVSFKVWTHL